MWIEVPLAGEQVYREQQGEQDETGESEKRVAIRMSFRLCLLVRSGEEAEQPRVPDHAHKSPYSDRHHGRIEALPDPEQEHDGCCDLHRCLDEDAQRVAAKSHRALQDATLEVG